MRSLIGHVEMMQEVEKSKIGHILVVDDEPDLVELYSIELERRGFTCDTAMCGEDALAIVKDRKIDLIITDFRMPKGNGLDLLQGVVAHCEERSLPRIPIILVTGYVEQDVITAMLGGASAVHAKPVSFKEILRDIESIGDTALYTDKRVHVRKMTGDIKVHIHGHNVDSTKLFSARNISIGGLQVVSKEVPMLVNASYRIEFIDQEMRQPIHKFTADAACVWQTNETSIDSNNEPCNEFLLGFAFSKETKKRIVITDLLRYF